MKVRVPTARTEAVWRRAPASTASPERVDSDTVLSAEVAVPDQPGRPLSPVFTGLLALLVVVAAAYGLLVEDAYRLVPGLTRQTWRAQDAVTLATVPVLLWSSRRARAGSLGAHLVAVGTLIWLTYGYAHLAIGAPFNAVFLVYVAVLVLAGFAMLDGLLRVDVAEVSPAFARTPRLAAAWFLAVAGAGIALLWLAEIVVALPGGLPTNIHLAELPNPTWVLDLGWIIPMALGAAVMLRRGHPAGPVVAGALLVMLLVLSVTMLTCVPFALTAGLGEDPVVSQQLVVFTAMFTVLGALEAWLLVLGRRRLGAVSPSWLRQGWWPGTT